MTDAAISSSSSSRKLSKVAGWASVICAIHCLASPLILGAVPVLNLSDRVELAMIAISVGVGVFSVVVGFREHHRRSVIVVFAIALAFIGASRLVDRFETPILVIGAVIMAVAQLMNLRFEREADACCATRARGAQHSPAAEAAHDCDTSRR